MKALVVAFGWLLLTTAHAQNLTNGLVAHYPFEGNPNDISSNGNNGFANNAVLCPDRFGIHNSAYRFNGANAQILVNDNVALRNLRSNYTFMVWAKFNSLPGRDMFFLTKSPGGGGQKKWIFWKHVGNPSGVGLHIYENFSINLNHNFAFTTNRWYFISFTAAATNATISIDGVPVSVQGANLLLPDTTDITLTIGGAEPGGNQWFHGDLDDVRIYNRALSSNEIAQAYQVQTGQILNVRKAVYLDSNALQVGTNYQVQSSGNLITWTNHGSPFIATNSSWRSSNYWDVENWDKLFFRIFAVP